MTRPVTTARPEIGFGRATTLNGRRLLAVVVAGSVVSLVGLGVRSTFGVYLDPVIESLGTDRGTFSLAIAVQNLLWGLSQPVAGAVADRFGTSRVLTAGALGYAASLLLMSTADSSAVFFLSAGLGVGVATGAGSFSLVLAAVGRMAPPDKAPLALGIVTAMASVGQLVLVPSAQSLVGAYGWRTAVVVMAGVVLTVVLAAPVVRGNALQQQGGGAADAGAGTTPLRDELRRAAASRSFLLLNAAFFVCGFHVTFIGTHLVSYAGDVGVGQGAATAGLAIIGLFNIMGSLAAGHFGGLYSKTRLLAGIYAMRTVVILVFVLVPASDVSIVVFGAAIGVLWLSTVPLTGGIVNGLFGTTHAGTLFGIVFLGHQLGAFVGAWMGGEWADRADSYLPVWWVAAGLGLFAAVIHLMIDERPAPPAPIRARGAGGLAPAAGVAVIAVMVGAAALVQTAAAASTGIHRTDAGDPVADEVGAPNGFFCILHPIEMPVGSQAPRTWDTPGGSALGSG